MTKSVVITLILFLVFCGIYCIGFSIKIGEDSSFNEELMDFTRSSREAKPRKST